VAALSVCNAVSVSPIAAPTFALAPPSETLKLSDSCGLHPDLVNAGLRSRPGRRSKRFRVHSRWCSPRWLTSAARRCVLSPGEPKQKESRYLDIHEDDQLDEAQFAAWVKQAAALPGWVPSDQAADSTSTGSFTATRPGSTVDP